MLNFVSKSGSYYLILFLITNLVAVQHVRFARSNCRTRRIEQHLHDHSQNATPGETTAGAFLLKFGKKKKTGCRIIRNFFFYTILTGIINTRIRSF